MQFLSPDKIRTEKVGKKTVTIKEKIIPDSAVATRVVASYVNIGDKMKPCKKLADGLPLGITIHNTNDITVNPATTPAEQYTRATWPEQYMGGAVVHFYVYKDDVWQNLSETEQGWHAGDKGNRRKGKRGTLIGGNLDTIAIECIGSDPETEETGALLIAYLCKKYSLDPELDVYSHNYFMHGKDEIVRMAYKNCPYYILPHFKDFIDRIKELMSESDEKEHWAKKYYDILKNEKGIEIFEQRFDDNITRGEFFAFIVRLMNKIM